MLNMHRQTGSAMSDIQTNRIYTINLEKPSKHNRQDTLVFTATYTPGFWIDLAGNLICLHRDVVAYVDLPFAVFIDPPIYPFRGEHWCHMFTWKDCIQELHDFAAAIGLQRKWFQDRTGFPHYDLSPSRRAAAVKRGAIEVDGCEMVYLKNAYPAYPMIPAI